MRDTLPFCFWNETAKFKNPEILSRVNGNFILTIFYQESVVKKMPKWKAGRQRGKAVAVRYSLPVMFKLK